MNTHKYHTSNKREKNIAFFYVLILFVISTTVCCVLLFRYNTNFTAFSRKDFVMIKMERIRSFQHVQNRQAVALDSLKGKILSFNPGVFAMYEESDIKYLINEIKEVYEKSALDNRYKMFLHIAVFYETWFTDKKELWSKRENITSFKRNLEQCEIGLQNKKEDLRSHFKK